MEPHFELRRVRDFGEVISDTFTFVKENFKELYKTMLIICGVFIILNVITLIVMQRNTLEGVNSMKNGTFNTNIFDVPEWTINAFISSMLYFFSVIFYSISIFLTTYCYIAIYKDKPQGEKPTLPEVWGYYRYYFLRVLGASIVCTIFIAIGMLFCLLPGIYFGTVFSLLLPIIIFENASFGYSFNKSFSLIKGNWWLTFGILVVLSIVLSVTSLIISIPTSILQQAQILLKPDSWLWPLYCILILLNNILLLSYSIFAVAISLCYFSYMEQKEGTSLMDRINMLGKNDNNDPQLPAEQY